MTIGKHPASVFVDWQQVFPNTVRDCTAEIRRSSSLAKMLCLVLVAYSDGRCTGAGPHPSPWDIDFYHVREVVIVG
jgi:hypothetical protein